MAITLEEAAVTIRFLLRKDEYPNDEAIIAYVKPLLSECLTNCDGAALRIGADPTTIRSVEAYLRLRGVDACVTFNAKPWLDRLNVDALAALEPDLKSCDEVEVVLSSGDFRASLAVMRAMQHASATDLLAQEVEAAEPDHVGFSVELDETQLERYKSGRLLSRQITLAVDTP